MLSYAAGESLYALVYPVNHQQRPTLDSLKRIHAGLSCREVILLYLRIELFTTYSAPSAIK